MPRIIARYLRYALLLTLAFLGSDVQAEAPSGFFDRLGKVHVGPTRETTAPISFSCGHAKVTFTGRFTPLQQDGRLVGYYLDGNGGLDYASAYSAEWPVLTKNLKEWLAIEAVKMETAQKVWWSFGKARLMFVGGTLPAWEGGETSSLEEGYRAFQERWRKVDGYAPLHLLAAQADNAPTTPMAILEMEGKDNNLLYRFDPVEGFEESLEFLQPFKKAPADLKGWSGLLPLSRQPIGRDAKKGQVLARFQITGLDVDVRTEDNRRATVLVKETLNPIQPGQRVLTFELLSDIYAEHEHRRLKVTQVTDAQGSPLEFHHSHDHLAVRLPGAAPVGQPLTLTMAYEGDFLETPQGDNYWQLGVRGAWYPQPRHMAEENYLFHGTVRTKGVWQAFLPGETIRREKEGDWNLVETRTTLPICFATILGGKYFMEEEARDGLTLRVATYGARGGTAVKVIKEQAFNILSYYKQFLGAYPFKEFTIIEKNEWGYGQAPPTMTYISREAFEQISNIKQMQEMADMVGRWGGRVDFRTMDVRHVLAHEIAHQFWGTVVKMPLPEDQWITESFADYCAALYERDYKGEGHYKRNIAGWKSASDFAKDAAPIPLANDVMRKEGYDGYRIRTGLLYAKGPMLLLSLHQELGDQVFLTWLKSIQTNFKWKFAPTKRVFDLLTFITKKDYAPFYETYFWGLGMPPTK